MSEPILSVEGLGVSFDTPSGPATAVQDVSFDLRRGEALGIVGESGSGKTVTCRALLRLLPETARASGRIVVDDADVLSLSPRDLASVRGRKAAMIFQTPSSYLDPVRRVGDQIGEGLRFHFAMRRGEARDRSVELLRHVRIADPARRVDAYPHELSGGMKQRVMIAGAIACRPKILIADEPTTALDVTVQARILELLRELRTEDQLSLILVSHDLGVIASICDRVVVMKDGTIVEDGPTAQILVRPRASYTKELIAANPSVFAERRPTRTDGRTPTARPLLDVDHLSVTFGRERRALSRALLGPGTPPVVAVRDVSFTIGEGEALGLVGESGSGKTTIGRTIVGLASPSDGGVMFDGSPVGDGGRPSRGARSAIQMVFQDPIGSLNPRFTVWKTLSEPLLRHRICPAADVPGRVRSLMASVELPASFLDRRPHELSGGQCQRVAIARALTVEPRLLIADEVTSALDVTIQRQIIELLTSLRDRFGLTILFISHDLGVVRSICDRVVVLENGRVVEQGRTDDVLQAPTQEYTRQLIAAVPRMPAEAGGTRGSDHDDA